MAINRRDIYMNILKESVSDDAKKKIRILRWNKQMFPKYRNEEKILTHAVFDDIAFSDGDNYVLRKIV